ncbi:extensin family protein [Rhodoblastus acidophilus]|uniref:Extensin family protein n=1 Tax=Candidatus Rhodoblastus alkanivorans TaxID=2954117 RepID=A0ABS9Z4U4_9HYPH|nr:extensin family protein [Candidatus Rhodoblastus alkanivorans]MCI4677622.1 extensin family protein [Candidatus Rhodoblastus alkanivorans]MCI4682646.1 extensin family protein [Candidatus Rhodoblastus alkanivorans]MDI4639952.1 extensin family protein [Rhodoblastus acidophilus]
MARRGLTFLLFVIGLGGLAGCSKFERAQRPAWRARAENVCFADHRVAFSAYVRPASHEIDGPSICGLTRPLKVTALQDGAVMFNSTQTLDCSMVAELNQWLAEVVQPAAEARFRQKVVEIESMGSYNCRSMNHQFGARLSEHSFGNAIDIGGYRLADGRKITYVHDWTHGDQQTQAFLRDLHGGACQLFTTVLSPGSNPFHYNHMHVDLAMHGMRSTGPRHICRPARQNTIAPQPRDNLPETPDFDDDLDVAQAGAPRERPALAMRGESLAVSGAAPDLIRRRWRASLLAQTERILAQSPPPPPPRRPGDLRPVTLHAELSAQYPYPAPPRRESHGAIRRDGVYVPEGGPSDFDLH